LTQESSANVVTQPCGDVTTPTGTNIQLGPYGASMDVNVGAGFENTDPNDQPTCPTFVGIFKEAQNISQQLLDVGPQPCSASTPNTGNCLNFKLYTVYRPANWPSGKIPVLSWGNGTCAQPEGYGALLRYIASYGFFVVAANSREVGSGTEIRHALDFAAAADQDPSSPYYGHLDMTKVGVMGHSQGSAGAAAAASDARVDAAILFNAGDTAVKPYLAISGDLDITGYTAQAMATAINGQPKAAYLYYHNPAGNTLDNLRGHLVLMLTPERVTEAARGFWQLMLQDDATARNLFVGSSCGLCNHASDYDFGEHGL
jgi:pimeloyl-ACP methyl ester carboxylesterase